MFEGVSVAVVTPFRGGDIDEAAFKRIINHILDQGASGIVATGSTGETPTLSREERRRLWSLAVETVGDRGFVIAGTGTNSTHETIEVTREATDIGVHGCMVVAPYYNKPGVRGQIAHFLAVADATDVPLMLYNVPGRTGINVVPETVAAVAGHPRIVAIKEASGSLDQATEILGTTDLTVLSGDDSLTLPMLAAGASGLVSVAGHVAGRELVAMVDHYQQGRMRDAGEMHRRLLPLIQSLFMESNPAPVKVALEHLGLLENELRLPLVPVESSTRKRVLAEMEALGLCPSIAGG